MIHRASHIESWVSTTEVNMNTLFHFDQVVELFKQQKFILEVDNGNFIT